MGPRALGYSVHVAYNAAILQFAITEQRCFTTAMLLTSNHDDQSINQSHSL